MRLVGAHEPLLLLGYWLSSLQRISFIILPPLPPPQVKNRL